MNDNASYFMSKICDALSRDKIPFAVYLAPMFYATVVSFAVNNKCLFLLFYISITTLEYNGDLFKTLLSLLL